MKTNLRMIAMTIVTLPMLVQADSTTDPASDLRFYIIDEGGKRHISMIPSAGYDQSGQIRARANPNSIMYQHNQLLEQLKQEQAELEWQAEQDALKAIEAEQKLMEQQQENEAGLSSNPVGNVYLGRGSGPLLEQLIELEKRGGRIIE